MAFYKMNDELQLPLYKSTKILQNQNLLQKPYTSHFWAAGFSFSMGQMVYDCPYQEAYDEVFTGEE